MHNAHDTKAALVLDGTGKTGRRVTARLMTCRVSVRVGSRSGVPRFDWEARATWASARRDVGAVYVIHQPDLALPGAVETVWSCAELAVQSGARRLVLLSDRGEEETQRTEQTATPGVWGTQR